MHKRNFKSRGFPAKKFEKKLILRFAFRFSGVTMDNNFIAHHPNKPINDNNNNL